jgi:hypothetical protein
MVASHDQALACTAIRTRGRLVVVGLVVRDGSLTRRETGALAHELCHAVAAAQHLDRDPCHDEDGGVAER